MCFHVVAGGSVVCHDGFSMCIPRQNRLVNFMMPMWPRSALTRMHASVELALNSSVTAEPDRSWLICRMKSGLCLVLNVAVRLQGWNTGDTECGWDCGSPVPGFFLVSKSRDQTLPCSFRSSHTCGMMMKLPCTCQDQGLTDWRSKAEWLLSVNCYTLCQ